MVFADEVLPIHGSPAHLLSVHVTNQWLLADRIFLAHAASLRQTSLLARWKFTGFLHSFDLKRAVLDAASLLNLRGNHCFMSGHGTTDIPPTHRRRFACTERSECAQRACQWHARRIYTEDLPAAGPPACGRFEGRRGIT